MQNSAEFELDICTGERLGEMVMLPIEGFHSP